MKNGKIKGYSQFLFEASLDSYAKDEVGTDYIASQITSQTLKDSQYNEIKKALEDLFIGKTIKYYLSKGDADKDENPLTMKVNGVMYHTPDPNSEYYDILSKGPYITLSEKELYTPTNSISGTVSVGGNTQTVRVSVPGKSRFTTYKSITIMSPEYVKNSLIGSRFRVRSPLDELKDRAEDYPDLIKPIADRKSNGSPEYGEITPEKYVATKVPHFHLAYGSDPDSPLSKSRDVRNSIKSLDIGDDWKHVFGYSDKDDLGVDFIYNKNLYKAISSDPVAKNWMSYKIPKEDPVKINSDF